MWHFELLDNAGWSLCASCCLAAPHRVATASRCALSVQPNWPWHFGNLIVVCDWTRLSSLLSLFPLPQVPHTAAMSEVRCHRRGTRSHMTLKSKRRVAYWLGFACDSELWLAVSMKPASFHTSLNCVARKFSANCARINQHFLSKETFLLFGCQRKLSKKFFFS